MWGEGVKRGEGVEVTPLGLQQLPAAATTTRLSTDLAACALTSL